MKTFKSRHFFSIFSRKKQELLFIKWWKYTLLALLAGTSGYQLFHPLKYTISLKVTNLPWIQNHVLCGLKINLKSITNKEFCSADDRNAQMWQKTLH